MISSGNHYLQLQNSALMLEALTAEQRGRESSGKKTTIPISLATQSDPSFATCINSDYLHDVTDLKEIGEAWKHKGNFTFDLSVEESLEKNLFLSLSLF